MSEQSIFNERTTTKWRREKYRVKWCGVDNSGENDTEVKEMAVKESTDTSENKREH